MILLFAFLLPVEAAKEPPPQAAKKKRKGKPFLSIDDKIVYRGNPQEWPKLFLEHINLAGLQATR